MPKICLLLLGLCCLTFTTKLQAQVVGGEHTFQFLTLSNSARITSLGGAYTAAYDYDPNIAATQPAALNDSMHNQLSFSTAIYAAGINHGHAIYARHFDSLATTFSIGMKYISYGTFTATDPTGQILGDFKAGEYAFNVGAARQYRRWSYGMNLRAIFSTLESYTANGVAADLGVLYHNPKSQFTYSLNAVNIGRQLKSYTGTRESIPFDLQMSISKRLQYLPFRFSILAHHLHRWDIRYDDPNVVVEDFLDDGEEQVEKKYIADKFFRHFIFGGELLLGKALTLRFAYNHQRKQEMKINGLGSLGGYSMGLGIHIKRFKLDYGKAFYNRGASDNHFTLSWQL